jgi:hypothetical protein
MIKKLFFFFKKMNPIQIQNSRNMKKVKKVVKEIKINKKILNSI